MVKPQRAILHCRVLLAEIENVHQKYNKISTFQKQFAFSLFFKNFILMMDYIYKRQTKNSAHQDHTDEFMSSSSF